MSLIWFLNFMLILFRGKDIIGGGGLYRKKIGYIGLLSLWVVVEGWGNE